MMTYGIYELTPVRGGDRHRLIQSFDKKEDMQKVLDVLESVDNAKFHRYKVIELEVK